MEAVIVYTNDEGVLSVKLPLLTGDINKYDSIAGLIPCVSIKAIGPHPSGSMLVQELGEYFRGKIMDFDVYPLVPKGFSGFQKDVWRCLRRIPYGSTISYFDLALRIGRPGAARAVGQALKNNPWPILLPCHRVIGKNGALRGFSSGGIWKRVLLSLEGYMK
ncbi:methylated-DNA--[protein]-cysteine S-methyltransferase [bacterium]|nr:methylated-DNA--[protein]-cysteine S-methyltransferase [bacterium]